MINVCSIQIAQVAAMHRLPTIFGLTTFVEAGGLMAYGPNRPELWRRAATFVYKILKGAKPGELLPSATGPAQYQLELGRVGLGDTAVHFRTTPDICAGKAGSELFPLQA